MSKPGQVTGVRQIPDVDLENELRLAAVSMRMVSGSIRWQNEQQRWYEKIEREIERRRREHTLFEGRADWPHAEGCRGCLADVKRRKALEGGKHGTE